MDSLPAAPHSIPGYTLPVTRIHHEDVETARQSPRRWRLRRNRRYWPRRHLLLSDRLPTVMVQGSVTTKKCSCNCEFSKASRFVFGVLLSYWCRFICCHGVCIRTWSRQNSWWRAKSAVWDTFMFTGAAIIGATPGRPHFAFQVRSTIVMIYPVIDQNRVNIWRALISLHMRRVNYFYDLWLRIREARLGIGYGRHRQCFETKTAIQREKNKIC